MHNLNGLLDFNGRSEGFDLLDGSGTVSNLAASSTSTMTIGTGGGSSTFAGLIADGPGGGVMALTKTGSGTFTLPSANNYSGPTNINGGVLNILNAGSLGSSTAAVTVASGGSLQFQNFSLANPLNLNGGALVAPSAPIPIAAQLRWCATAA